MTTDDPKMVVTGKVRLSYANVFKARVDKNDDGTPKDGPGKYSAMLLIPKSDTKTINAIKKAQTAALVDLKEKLGGKKPVGWKNTLRDGDEERDTDEQPEYAGMMFMNVSSQRRPGVVDEQRQPLTADDTVEGEAGIYSGVYARVAIRAYAFKRPDAKGISFGLEHVQRWADGEPLGAVHTKAEDVFEDLETADDGDESLL